jgi:translation initiation factor 2 subunit 1
VTASTPERQEGIDLVQQAIDRIEKTIKNFGGSFSVQMGPKVVTQVDEEELLRAMERAQLENEEKAGDDDQDEDENGVEGNKENNEEDEEDEEEETK